MTTTNDDHADREQEAAIRKRIAEEVRQDMLETPMRDDYTTGWLHGMSRAIAIIERGTGVAGEGEG